MANWSNPTLTSLYTNFLTELKARDEDLAKQFDGQTVSNLITGAIRWNSSVNRWQKWSGTAWGELATTYALTGLSTTGAASIGGALTVTGAAALNGGGTSTTPATADNSTAISTTAYVKAQGYATLVSPALTGTPTAPTAAAGTNTTQLATCAYVNAEIANDALLKTGGTLTGVLQVPSGTVAANGLQVGAAGTGLYSAAAGVLALASEGTEVLRISPTNNLLLGTTTDGAASFRNSKPIQGSAATSSSQTIDALVAASVTGSGYGIISAVGTAASTALSGLVHFQAQTGPLGAGTTITNQYGFVASSSIAGATNDFGFYGALAAGTGNWNCYMAGTAPNYFAGQVQLGAGSVSAPSLSTSGDTDTGIYFPAAGLLGFAVNGAIAGAFDDSGNLRLYNAAGTFYHNVSNQPTANRTVTLPDASVTLVSGTMVPTTGTGATGTWGISVSGSAASLTTGRTISLTGDVTGTSAAFNGTANASIAATIAAGVVGTTELANSGVTAAKLSGAQSGTAPIYGARAWVNFSGVGTVTIRADGNVTSITDNGVGDYTVNFTTALPDTSYSYTFGTDCDQTTNFTGMFGAYQLSGATKTTAAFRFRTGYSDPGSTTALDLGQINVVFFR
jgi:hypothetical protein